MSLPPNNNKINSKKYSHILANPAVLFYTLPWLMLLIIIGTVSQRYIGLYDSVQLYFASIIFWLGPLPLPGGLLTIAVITLALTIKFLFFSKWNWAQSGIILTHLGVLTLLYGGLITSITTVEGYMVIPEDAQSSSFSSYHERIFKITPEKSAPIIIPFETLKIGKEISVSDLSFKIYKICQNCSAQAPTNPEDETLKALAVNMELISVPSEKEKEANLSGITISVVNSTNEDELGQYILLEDIPKNPKLSVSDSETATLSLTRAQTPLGFDIKLNDFRKINYSATNKAREYKSDLIIYDHGVEWPVHVSMNKPWRYKGYTFYQSSFVENPDQVATVLNVVQNSGRAFPYISSLIIFIGLLLHLIIRLNNLSRKGRGA